VQVVKKCNIRLHCHCAFCQVLPMCTPSNRCFIPPTSLPAKMAHNQLKQFVQFTSVTNKQTDTQTTKPAKCAAIGHIYTMHVMWPTNRHCKQSNHSLYVDNVVHTIRYDIRCVLESRHESVSPPVALCSRVKKINIIT